MDLSYTPDEEHFRSRVRSFLRANLPAGWGTSGYVALRGRAYVEFLRDWTRKLAEGGFLGMSWPKEYGGQDAGPMQLAIFNQEMARHRAPGPINIIGLTYGRPHTHRARHRGAEEEIRCKNAFGRGDVVPGVF
jgi:alkylation response protein AidB-like acyl-CoA dehydrogenase